MSNEQQRSNSGRQGEAAKDGVADGLLDEAEALAKWEARKAEVFERKPPPSDGAVLLNRGELYAQLIGFGSDDSVVGGTTLLPYHNLLRNPTKRQYFNYNYRTHRRELLFEMPAQRSCPFAHYCTRTGAVVVCRDYEKTALSLWMPGWPQMRRLDVDPQIDWILDPWWRSDGSKFLFSGRIRQGDSRHIAICELDPRDGKSSVLYSDPPYACYSPSYTSDERGVLFGSTRDHIKPPNPMDACDYLCSVRVLELSSGKVRRIPGAYGGRPRWQPGGEWIVMEGRRDDGDIELWACKADGSRLQQVTFGTANNPFWSPDGKWLAFEGVRRGGAAGIYRLDWHLA